MNVFVRRAEGHEKDIIRVPETGKDLLSEGQVIRWSSYWRQREISGMIISGRNRNQPDEIKSPSVYPEGYEPPTEKSRRKKLN